MTRLRLLAVVAALALLGAGALPGVAQTALPGVAQTAPPGAPQTTPPPPGVPPAAVDDEPAAPVDTVPGAPPPPGPEITAAGAVLWDPADDVVLYGRDERVGRPMASTTKIMTVLLALEALDGREVAEELTVSPAAAEIGRVPGGASLGLRDGQVVAVRSVLAALLLRSGNDGAVAVAEHLAGDEPAFARRMNTRARELGLIDTHFVNASGLTDDPQHRAAPLDLARLGAIAMAHPDFAAWAGASELTVEPFGPLANRNELLGVYPGITGIKTGFTSLAGQCLVASATRDGRTLYAVVLGSEDRVADVTALFDYGFDEFARPAPLAGGQLAGTYRWSDAEVDLLVAGDLARTVVAGTPMAWRAALQPAADLPVVAGAPLGVAELLADGRVIASTQLLSAASAEPPPGGGSVPGALADALRAFARLDPPVVPLN